MESNHLTTHTYTAPTCTLIVSSRAADRPRNQESHSSPVDFILELERSELGDLDRVTLQGQPQQLDALHHSVERYVAELVAKFPSPTTDPRQSAPDRSIDLDPVNPPPSSQLDPRDDRHSPRSGIIKNLPGLRGSLPPSPAANLQSATFDGTKPSISNLLGRWVKPNRPDPRQAANRQQNYGVEPIAGIEDRSTQPTAPYLTGASERSLDHHLYLGDLATPTSSDKLTLSAIQLFDLAAVLDEYATEHITSIEQSNLLSRSMGERTNRPPQDTGALDATRTHLPNLPRKPAPQPTEVGQAYYRAPRRSSFMSGIPWAVAAAVAVGVPLLLLDPNSNPLKDAASKVKIPNLIGTKKVTKSTKSPIATTPGATPTQSDLNNPPSALPKPWEQQTVQPPVNTKPIDPTTLQTDRDPRKLGTAPLPDAISGAGIPTNPGNLNATIAPNPLTTDRSPGAIDRSSNTTSGIESPQVAKKPAGASPTTKIGQLPIDAGTSKVSVSKQPMLLPPSTPPIVTPPTTTPIPFNRSGLDESGRIDPATRPNPKKTVQKVKPTTPPKQAVLNPTPGSAPPVFEPLTPVPTNPNLIDPNQNNPEPVDPQPPAIVPSQPLQSNAGGFGSDPVETPSLQETKRYFQGKWKASTTQTNALQYVLQVSGKSGTVRSVSPQGAAATSYLQQTKFIKTGQKLISPAAAGSTDQKIRVLLQPDGNVDTFIEP